MQFTPEQRAGKWGATSAWAAGETVENVLGFFSDAGPHPFESLVRLCDVTEGKAGYRFVSAQVSLDWNHKAFPAIADLMEEAGGTEFEIIIIQSPTPAGCYVVVASSNVPEEEARPDHPLLVQLAKWLGGALVR